MFTLPLLFLVTIIIFFVCNDNVIYIFTIAVTNSAVTFIVTLV